MADQRYYRYNLDHSLTQEKVWQLTNNQLKRQWSSLHRKCNIATAHRKHKVLEIIDKQLDWYAVVMQHRRIGPWRPQTVARTAAIFAAANAEQHQPEQEQEVAEDDQMAVDNEYVHTQEYRARYCLNVFIANCETWNLDPLEVARPLYQEPEW